MFGEVLVIVGVGVDVLLVDPAIFDEDVCDAVEEGEVRFRHDGIVLGGSYGGLCGSGVYNDDFWFEFIFLNSLPHDGVGDAEVGADENDDV